MIDILSHAIDSFSTKFDPYVYELTPKYIYEKRIEDSYSPMILSSIQTLPYFIDFDRIAIMQEVAQIKKLVKDRLGVDIENYWIPDEDSRNNSLTILVKCELSEELQNDFDRLWDFEVDLYVKLKDFFENSQKIKMIALL